MLLAELPFGMCQRIARSNIRLNVASLSRATLSFITARIVAIVRSSSIAFGLGEIAKPFSSKSPTAAPFFYWNQTRSLSRKATALCANLFPGKRASAWANLHAFRLTEAKEPQWDAL
jgi:hypothetical protein